jgi:hypothetical protein
MRPDERLDSARAQLDASAADFTEGASLLEDVRSFVKRFCSFPSEHALIAVTLWVAHSHVVSHFHTTPRLALISPEPGSGKTRVLEVLDLLVPASMFCLSASPAAIFRTLAKNPITLLVDECDAVFNRRGKDDANEDLRAFLNAGYKRGATIPRCVGPKHDVQNFAVFCATALAGIGDLPDTIMTRSVVIRMRRRAPNERVEPFRTREHSAPGNVLRDRLARWATLHGPTAGAAWPKLPAGIVDRPAEVWEPLIATADAAGGEWPARAREACVAMCKAAQDNRVSLGIRLLSDLRILFAAAGNPEALHTETLLTRLCDGPKHGLEDDAPWNELHGKPLGVRGLANFLKKYSVNPTKVKVDGQSLQGYRREHLWDAWNRYLAPTSAQAEPAEPVELADRNDLVSRISGSIGSAILHKVPNDDREKALLQVSDSSAETNTNRADVPTVPQVPHPRESESAVSAQAGNRIAADTEFF